MSVEIYKVKNLDEILDKATFTGGVLETCIRITTEAKSLCPVALENGGRLRNSIMYRTKLQEGLFNNESGPSAPKKLDSQPKGNEGYVGSNLEYAVYQEFGTRYMFAQPFLRPAAHIVAGRDVKKIIEAIQKNAYDNIKKVKPTKEAQR